MPLNDWQAEPIYWPAARLAQSWRAMQTFLPFEPHCASWHDRKTRQGCAARHNVRSSWGDRLANVTVATLEPEHTLAIMK